MIDEQLFLREFLQIDFHQLENRKEDQQNLRLMKIDQLISNYYKYLKIKSYHYLQDISLKINQRTDKKLYFTRLSNQQLLQELNLLSELLQYGFDTTDTYVPSHLQFNLLCYIYLQFLMDYFKIHSSTILCISACLSKLNGFNYEELLIFKQLLVPFSIYSDKLVDYICQHQSTIVGFDVVEQEDVYFIDDLLIEQVDHFITITHQNNLNNQSYPPELVLNTNRDVVIYPTYIQYNNQRCYKSLTRSNKSSITYNDFDFDREIEEYLTSHNKSLDCMFDSLLFHQFQNNYQNDYHSISDKHKNRLSSQNNESIIIIIIIILLQYSQSLIEKLRVSAHHPKLKRKPDLGMLYYYYSQSSYSNILFRRPIAFNKQIFANFINIYSQS